MACIICDKYCGGAHAAMWQIVTRTYSVIFRPEYTRERMARGLASVIVSFRLRGYHDWEISRMLDRAPKDCDRKTRARAEEMARAAMNPTLADDTTRKQAIAAGKASPGYLPAFVREVAETMAAGGFKDGSWNKRAEVLA